MIRKENNKWFIHFTDGRKEGPFDSRAQAQARDAEIKKIMYLQKEHDSNT